ncbi:MAG: 3-deoxy-8-phosphooctulonate synthase [Nitrospinota bacterium]
MKVEIKEFGITIDNKSPFIFIGGSCVITSRDSALRNCEDIKTITDKLGIPYIYKSSYDKANRTSLGSFRGVGLDEGLKILQEIRSTFNLPVVSDVHSPSEISIAKDVLDIIQIPAFLCRQTDLLLAAGASGKIVNIKKGQFVAPGNMQTAIEKVKAGGSSNIMLTERGTFFGYNSLVVDMSSLPLMADLGVPVIFDAGHSVQSPSFDGVTTGGNRRMIPYLAKAAIATKIAGLFLETDKDPDNAPCDGPNMLAIDQLESLLRTVAKIDAIVKE